MKKLWFWFFPLILVANPLAYFSTKNGEIAIVDPRTNTFAKKYQLSFGGRVGGEFLGLAIASHQQVGYVLDGVHLGVWVVDLERDRAAAFVELEGMESPDQIFVHPYGSKVFVTEKGKKRLFVIDSQTLELSHIELDSEIVHLEVNPLNGVQIYATKKDGGVVIIEGREQVPAKSVEKHISFATDIAYQFVEEYEELLPPETFEAREICDRFAMQTERIHLLSWGKSPSEGVVGYLVSKNGKVIAVETGLDFSMQCHNCATECAVYEVRAIDHASRVSAPVRVVVDRGK